MASFRQTMRFTVVIMTLLNHFVTTISVPNPMVWKYFSSLDMALFIIQIKYGLPYCVTCPSMSTDPGSRGVAKYPGGGIPGSVRILGQVTQFWQNILNLYYSTGSWKLFHTPYRHSVSEGGSVSSSWKWWPVIMSPAHNPLPLQVPILLHSMTLADYIGDKNWIQQVLVGLSSSFPINHTYYHYTAVGKYYTFVCSDVGWCQLAWGTMETGFVYFLIVKWTLQSACFNQHSNDTNLHFRDQTDVI